MPKERPLKRKDFEEYFKKGAQLARDDERISKIAWLWYYMCYIEYDWRGISSWPHLCNVLGEYGNIIPILVLLAGYGNMVEIYDEKEIPSEVRESTYSGIESSLTRFKSKHEEPGTGNDVLAWVVRYFSGKLYYLGRLQYEFINCRNNILVYRNRSTGQVVCLAEDGQMFSKDGQYARINGTEDEKNTWMSEYGESNESIYGNLISPESYAINKKIVLDKKEWELMLKRGDPTINIHIPGGSRLDHNAVKESFLQAQSFFSTYFPEYKWRGFVCHSWLLSPQLREFLKSDSNITKFQDTFYMFPVSSPSTAGVYRFFI